MGVKTINLYLIQSPAVAGGDGGYNNNLLEYYDGSISIKNIDEFLFRASYEVATKGALIKKLVIGSHGFGIDSGYGGFRIGDDLVNYENLENGSKKNDLRDKLEQLKPLRFLFAKDADVYIMACKTGKSANLLMNLSRIWGGVRVHGYTGDILTQANLLSVSVEKEGEEIVCVPGACVGSNRIILPYR